MGNAPNTTGFGAPREFGAHHFFAEIPADPKGAVTIYEDYGLGGDNGSHEGHEGRVTLARELWAKVRDSARQDFNERLKAKKQGTGSWRVGRVKLDRFLGRELCVLAWAAEHASPEECPVICQKWRALRPEERWWLYSKTAAEAGLARQQDRGWRKALYCALSDGEGIKLKTRFKPGKRKDEDLENLNLMDILKGEK